MWPNFAQLVAVYHKGRRHAATSAQELPTVQALLGPVDISQLFDAGFDLLLLSSLGQRIELSIRDHLGRHWRVEGVFRRFNLREFSGTEIGSHPPPPPCIDAHGAPLCVGHGLFRSYMGRLLLGESIPERTLSLDNQSRHQSSEVVS